MRQQIASIMEMEMYNAKKRDFLETLDLPQQRMNFDEEDATTVHEGDTENMMSPIISERRNSNASLASLDQQMVSPNSRKGSTKELLEH